nr:discoidin domain-containing protein [Lachnospiraceae bacterium]
QIIDCLTSTAVKHDGMVGHGMVNAGEAVKKALNTKPVEQPTVDKNLALGKSITASSIENDSLTPNFAVDGDMGTRWSSDWSYGNQWVIVDLGKTYDLTSAVLNWEAAYGTSYEFYVSDDGQNWRYAKYQQNNTVGEVTTNLDAKGRYVKINFYAKATQYGYSLYELAIMGH